jgi:hypothetical protein
MCPTNLAIESDRSMAISCDLSACKLKADIPLECAFPDIFLELHLYHVV